MKKEDFADKWYLRSCDLKPEKVEFILNKYTLKIWEKVYEAGLLFDSKEDAELASRNAIAIARGISQHTIMQEPEDNENDQYKPRVYISGPISTKTFEDCKERFGKVEEKLIAKGYRVFNPLKNGLPFDADTHRHMRRDLNILTNEDDPFDYIYMMRRWPHSSGCKTEMDNAIASGITVVFEESEDAVKFI